jgi:hypothetical protein
VHSKKSNAQILCYRKGTDTDCWGKKNLENKFILKEDSGARKQKKQQQAFISNQCFQRGDYNTL